MIVLHGGIRDGQLCLWGETPSPSQVGNAGPATRRGRKPAAPPPELLPYDAGSAALSAVLKDAGVSFKPEKRRIETAVAWLPTLQFSGTVDPVVQVVDESDGQTVYTLRIKGDSYRPKVFKKGSYTVNVEQGKLRKSLKGIRSLAADEQQTLKVELGSD